MKKLIILFIVILFGITAFAHEIGFDLSKEVNGNWKEALIINFEVGQIYPKAYLNTELVFEAPRADMLKPDHKYFETVVGAKFGILNGELNLNTGARQAFGGDITFTNNTSLFWRF